MGVGWHYKLSVIVTWINPKGKIKFIISTLKEIVQPGGQD